MKSNHSQSTTRHGKRPGAILRASAILALAAAGLLCITASAAGAEPAPGPMVVNQAADGSPLKLQADKSVVLKTSRPYKRVAVAAPEIAAVNAVGPLNVLLTGKKAGSTQLIVWDDNDQTQTIDIVVEMDTAALQAQLTALFPDAKIQVSTASGAVILKGRVPNLAAGEHAALIAAPFGTKVHNLLEVAGGQQVMLQVRFAEVSRSASTALGINGAFADGAFVGGNNVGAINSTNLIGGGKVGVAPPIAGTVIGKQPVQPGVTLYGAGQIGSFYLEGFIAALRQNNLLRILAEPNLVTSSGEKASILAGGEFPIPVAGGAAVGSDSAVTIQFREFGVKLNFTPTVTGEGRIRLNVAPEVSDLDYTTAVRVSGFVVPGLTQRKVNTTVELAEGQTFAIGGLLNSSVTANKDTVPILGDLPIIGPLFRSVRYQRKETELVVLVTPRLVEAMNPGQVPPAPGEGWRHPKEADLFMKGDLGGPALTPGAPAATGAPGETPSFYGEHGFTPAKK